MLYREEEQMQNVSLSFVRSQLQLLNCIEANKSFSENDTKVLLLLERKDVDRKLMEQVLDSEGTLFDKVLRCDLRSNFKQIKLVLYMLMKYKKISTCFIGDTTRIVNIAINSLVVDRFIKVDDGASTFFAAKWVESKSYKVLNRHQEPIPKFLQMINDVLRLNPDFCERMSFFTIYTGIQEYAGSIEVIHNDYRFLKQRISELPVKDEIFFIGSDIRRYILNDPDDFEKYIAAVVKYYSGRKINYIMHRKENENDEQRQYYKYLNEKYGIHFVIFDKILEQQILHQGWIPCEVATFFSSAIDTLVVIYNPNATVFRLASDDIREKSRFGYSEMLRHYASMKVNVVEI